MTPDDFKSNTDDGAAPLNVTIEDYLAMGATEHDHAMLLHAWLFLGVERLARVMGREYARDILRGLMAHIRDATPTEPWKE